MKQSRYYQIIEGKAHIYDSPLPERSVTESIVSISDLAYYRKNFQLSKVWASNDK